LTSSKTFTGRGSSLHPPNRFDRIQIEDDFEQLEHDEEFTERSNKFPTQYFKDDSQSVVSENNSPDIPFRFSVNPYRGCAHGCSYCYARPTHEYLGFNAGLDFETKIMVKHDAPELLRAFLSRNSWQPEMIAFSGVTDCYQPAERKFALTRSCIEVAAEARQPIGVVTKNAMVLRDRDFLAPMAEQGLAHVLVSITTLDAELARSMEPRTSTPNARLRAIKELAEAGIPTKVMVSPIIPGLNDSEIPAILEAAKDAGATSAGYILLRLPLTVEPVFLEWLERTHPDHVERVQSRIRQCREGEMSDATFGSRMRGKGPIAEQISQMFRVFATKYNLSQPLPPLNTSLFQPPSSNNGQMRLF